MPRGAKSAGRDGTPAADGPVELLLGAFRRRDRRALEALAARGVALEARDSTGRTVLMRAAEGEEPATLQITLSTDRSFAPHRLREGPNRMLERPPKG